MKNENPLLLSQQILAWTLRAFGLAEDLAHIKEGTLKNARQAKIIDRSWLGLTRELVRAFGGEPEAAEALAPALRAFDAGMSSIDVTGLDTPGRTTALALTFAPELAVRAGALAATFEQSDLAERDPELAARLAEAAAEPLSPLVFRRVVDALFDRYAPEISTVSKRALEFDDQVETGARPYERWGDGTVPLPHRTSIDKILNYFAPLSDGMAGPIEIWLMLARASCQLQRDVQKYVDAEMADAVRAVTHRIANQVRSMLATGDSTRQLVEWAVEHLRGPHGENTLATYRAFGFDTPHNNPTDAADQLLDDYRQKPRTTRWLVILQVVLPFPRVAAAAQAMTGAVPGMIAVQKSLPELLQVHIEGARLVRALADSDLSAHSICVGSKPAADAGSVAREVHRRFDLRVRVQSDWTPFADELQALLDLYSFVQGGPDAHLELRKQLAATAVQLELPGDAERVWGAVGGDAHDLPPHMLASRALRVAQSGDTEQAIGLLKRWMASRPSAGATTAEERHTVAATAVAIGHVALDRAWQSAEDSANDNALEAWAAEFSERLRLAESCLSLGFRLYSPHVSHLEHIAQTVECLPLALRVSYAFEQTARELQYPNMLPDLLEATRILTEAQRQHPDAWIALAIAQRVRGEDPRATDKRVRHFGGKARLTAELKRLEDDGVFAPR